MKRNRIGINGQALAESVCYILFGILLFRLTVTGEFLSYVTPRMKPYIYGLSVLMFLWGAMGLGKIFRPRYKNRISHCLVLCIPILILFVPPAPAAGNMAVRTYTGSDLYGSLSGAARSKTEPSIDYQEEEVEEKPDEYLNDTQPKTQGLPQTEPVLFNGLDEEAKTITIADEDFYNWMTELGTNADHYEGYTITMKGFVFLDLEERKENEFALVRLSMWCCSADLSPIGLMADDPNGLTFKENDWVTVKGKLLVVDGYPTIEADNIEAAEKPEQEYVYPYY